MMTRFVLAALMFGLVSGGPAAAYRDHDDVRERVQEGQLVPYAQVRRQVEQRFQGRIVGAQIQQTYVYRIKVLRPDGRVLMINVDGRNSRVLKVEGQR